MAGAISMLANFAMFFGGRDSEGRPANPIAGIAVAMLAPLAASLIQMAISRAREFEADRGGAEISGDPRCARVGAREDPRATPSGMPLERRRAQPGDGADDDHQPAVTAAACAAVLDPSVDRGAGRAPAGDGRSRCGADRRARARASSRRGAAEIPADHSADRHAPPFLALALALPAPCSWPAATCSASSRPRRSPPRARPTARRSAAPAATPAAPSRTATRSTRRPTGPPSSPAGAT